MGNHNESEAKPNDETIDREGANPQKQEMKKLKEIPVDHVHKKKDRVHINLIHHNTGLYLGFEYCSTYSLLTKHERRYCTLEHLCRRDGGCTYPAKQYQIEVTPEMEASFITYLSPILALNPINDECDESARDYSSFTCELIYEKKEISLQKTVTGGTIKLPPLVQKLYKHLDTYFVK